MTSLVLFYRSRSRAGTRIRFTRVTPLAVGSRRRRARGGDGWSVFVTLCVGLTLSRQCNDGDDDDDDARLSKTRWKRRMRRTYRRKLPPPHETERTGYSRYSISRNIIFMRSAQNRVVLYQKSDRWVRWRSRTLYLLYARSFFARPKDVCDRSPRNSQSIRLFFPQRVSQSPPPPFWHLIRMK